jgi:hypothetical protein
MSSAPGVETLARRNRTRGTGNDLARSASLLRLASFRWQADAGGNCPQDRMIPKVFSSSPGTDAAVHQRPNPTAVGSRVSWLGPRCVTHFDAYSFDRM